MPVDTQGIDESTASSIEGDAGKACAWTYQLRENQLVEIVDSCNTTRFLVLDMNLKRVFDCEKQFDGIEAHTFNNDIGRAGIRSAYRELHTAGDARL